MNTSPIFVNRLIETLEEMSRYSQYVDSQYLFSMLRIRAQETKEKYTAISGALKFASGPNEFNHLLPINSVVSFLQNNSGNDTVETPIVQMASGEINDETLATFGTAEKLYSVLFETFGNIDKTFPAFTLADFTPFFYNAVKLHEVDIKISRSSFLDTLLGSGLFGRFSKTKFVYMNDSDLETLLDNEVAANEAEES
jgi:hypothetical protein